MLCLCNIFGAHLLLKYVSSGNLCKKAWQDEMAVTKAVNLAPGLVFIFPVKLVMSLSLGIQIYRHKQSSLSSVSENNS